jgi:hypothetical protein
MIVFCVVLLACLLASVMTPRVWTTSALVQVAPDEAKDAEYTSLLAARLESALPAASGDSLETVADAGGLSILLRSSDPERSFEQLSLVLAKVTREELADRRRSLASEISQVEKDTRLSAAALEAATRDLERARDEALGAYKHELPERIAGMDTRSAVLTDQIRKESALRKDLLERVVNLRVSVGPLQADPRRFEMLQQRIVALRAELRALRASGNAEPLRIEELEKKISRDEVEVSAMQLSAEKDVARVQQEFEPAMEKLDRELESTAARLSVLTEDLDAQRLGLGAARAQLEGLLSGSSDFQDRQKHWSEVDARDHKLRERLQVLRDRMVTGRSGAQLPFEVVGPTGPPSRPDGLPPWAILVLSTLAGTLAILIRLLTRSPTHFEDRASHMAVRWEAVSAAILLTVTVAASAFFLAVTA